MAGFYGSLLVKIFYLVVHEVGPVSGQGCFHDNDFGGWYDWRLCLKLQQVARSDGLEDEVAVCDPFPGSEVLRQAACLGDGGGSCSQVQFFFPDWAQRHQWSLSLVQHHCLRFCWLLCVSVYCPVDAITTYTVTVMWCINPDQLTSAPWHGWQQMAIVTQSCGVSTQISWLVHRDMADKWPLSLSTTP